MLEFGFFIDGEYHGRKNSAEKGHIEIANRILEEHSSWKSHYETQNKWKDPVDFLVFVKAAIKIGNRWGRRVVTYSSQHLNEEMQECIREYQKSNWAIEDVFYLK